MSYDLIRHKTRALAPVEERLGGLSTALAANLGGRLLAGPTTKSDMFGRFAGIAEGLSRIEPQVRRAVSLSSIANTSWTRDGVTASLVEVAGRPVLHLNDTKIKDQQRNMLTPEQVEQAIAPRMLSVKPSPSRAELAVLPEAELHRELYHCACRQVDAVAKVVSSNLDRLVGGMEVGIIEWLATDVARFCFWRTNITERSSSQNVGTERTVETHSWGSRTTEKTKIRKTVGRNVVKQLHLHDVISARILPISEIDQYAAPASVRLAVKHIPHAVKMHLKLVVGKEIYTEQAEAEVDSTSYTDEEEFVRAWEDRTEESWRNTHRSDPAIVLGPYVLMGW